MPSEDIASPCAHVRASGVPRPTRPLLQGAGTGRSIARCAVHEDRMALLSVPGPDAGMQSATGPQALRGRWGRSENDRTEPPRRKRTRGVTNTEQ